MSDIKAKYKNLEALVYEEIKSMIFEQKLPPNSKIVEEDISRQLNVSRTPVRTALTALVKDGLVKIIPRRGAYVVSIGIEVRLLLSFLVLEIILCFTRLYLSLNLEMC